MSAPDRIWHTIDRKGRIKGCPDAHVMPCADVQEAYAEYVRAKLCDPQDARVTQLVEAAIAEDTVANKRVTSRERKQYLRGRIEALKDLRAALRALEQGNP